MNGNVDLSLAIFHSFRCGYRSSFRTLGTLFHDSERAHWLWGDFSLFLSVSLLWTGDVGSALSL
jgi:hypothetical protein